jgi:ElaB/YqjD/DUF883 family membrane-anchored ribosome-binding protein
MSNTEAEAKKAVREEAPYIGEALHDLEDRFAPKIEEAKQQLNAINGKVKGFIRENPGTTLLAAVGIGYLIGRMASRR